MDLTLPIAVDAMGGDRAPEEIVAGAERAASELGYEVELEHVENPRVEQEEHYYNPAHTKLLDLGLRPHLLSAELVESMFSVIARFKDRANPDHILPRDRWRPQA